MGKKTFGAVKTPPKAIFRCLEKLYRKNNIHIEAGVMHNKHVSSKIKLGSLSEL